ncbi:unnamed protein product [Musa banksii]
MSSSYNHHLLLLLLLLCLIRSFSTELITAALCLPEESSALLQLKNGFSNSSSKLASWQLGSDCCLWDGVTCDPATGRVTALDLSGRSLSGGLDRSLFNLTSLTSLNLAYNLFRGIRLLDFPFSKLANLAVLNLSNAGFGGQIPAGIGRLEKLVSLDLSTLYLEELPNSTLKLHDPDLGTIIRNLSNLKELLLDGVNISADGYDWCRAVSASNPGLQFLSLMGCSLTGPLHSSLAGLRSLSKLRLDQNNLNSSLPEFFGNFSSLIVLRMSSCRLQGSIPQGIFRLRNLTVLDVSDNSMLSGRLPHFPEDSALESLVLFDTNLSGPLPPSIGNLKALSRLLLSRCSFSGSIPRSIANLTQLAHLDLSFNGFSGEIPPVRQWSKISEIILTSNNLTGPIPSSLGNEGLRNLTKIDMRNNSLSGSIPGSLFALPSLQLLQLSQNQFSAQLEEFSIASPSLNTVDLSNNKLQGSIPTSLIKLSGLKVLSLASNNFSGTLEIDRFQNLRNLSNLDLSNNMLSVRDGSNSSWYGSFPKISTLKLVSCNLEKIPAFLQSQDQISSLDLSNNRIPGAIPRWIWSIGNGNFNYLNLSFNLFTSVERPPPDLSNSSMMILDLHHNMLQGPIPLLPLNTIVLDYSQNNFTSSIPASFSTYLTYTILLSLSKNSLTGEIPFSICSAIYLQVLDLSDNNLSGSIPSCLMESSIELGVLNLRGNQFHGSIPENISELCALRTINLNQNQLEGKLPRSLANCYLLEVLDLGNNQFVDTFPYWLGNLSALRVLVLKSNRFYGAPVHLPGTKESNCTFLNLQIFDLSSNQFTGNLPENCFKNLKAMMFRSDDGLQTVEYGFLQFSKSSYYQNTVTIMSKGQSMTLLKVLTIFRAIDLSNNMFNGSIPEVIGELNLLCVLNFSHNSLIGEIPPQLGNMLQLESLDLSLNNLSGKIPQALASLTFLSFLNLSYNNLVGQIPQGPQFQTFSDTSFEGNKGLCGTPFLKQCGEETHSDSKLSSSESSTDLNWQCIIIGLGFGGGMALFVVPLMMWDKGKRWYNKHIDKMLWAIVPRLPCETCTNVKVGAEDVNYDTVEIEDEGRRFCLFCTQLELRSGQAIIHHVECSCHYRLADES